MKVVFRVDSSSVMGIGHLVRCLTLADELQRRNHEIIFICRELNGSLIKSIKYEVLVLSGCDNLHLNWMRVTQEQDAKQTIEVIPEKIDYLIVDSYGLDASWHQKLRPYTKKIMVIDDLADKKFDCDVLLNQNLGSQKESYENKVPRDCKLLLGCDYALLRPEFSDLREKSLEKRSATTMISNVLVSMGGSDNKNITYKVLQQLSDKYNITVVLGGSSPHVEMISCYAKDKGIRVIVDSSNMSKLMFDADLAIGTGGSTSWERCCLGLPTLLYISADNQKKVARNLEKLKAIKIVKDLKQDLQKIQNKFELWKNMSEKSQNICNGLGVVKVRNSLEYLIN
jgi:UDP-2,4-diacetamido-2,4,6-trideoxy-beta-L-altropyranose hydrolase